MTTHTLTDLEQRLDALLTDTSMHGGARSKRGIELHKRLRNFRTEQAAAGDPWSAEEEERFADIMERLFIEIFEVDLTEGSA